MAKSIHTTPQRLREVLHYCRDTGVFSWKVHRRKVRAGTIAGTPDRDGYINIKIDGFLYRAHRLAWLYVFGNWPTAQIDHINGDRNDNRLSNLREATVTENSRNARKKSNNKSGRKGVFWQDGRWCAQIKIGGKSTHIGRFDSLDDASAAYLRAAEKHFGSFARS
jgi:hypothetical protein